MNVIVVDLGFGDAGKGATVDWLCATRPVAAVVRFNGGAQAAHNVVAEGRHHTFSQFGSGTFSGVPTLLSEHMLVEPIALAAEARALEALGVADPLALVSVHERALLTTPIHVAANRARDETRRHGSCGKGIGETASYALTREAPQVADCRDPGRLRRQLEELARHYEPLVGPSSVDELVALYREFASAVRIVDSLPSGRLVFEGAQGVLLDEWRGFHPHTTWSTVEPRNARRLGGTYVLGVVRTYQTRHGAGPFPTEDPTLRHPEPHNATGEFQGAFRLGHFDPILLRYAIASCGGVDGLAVTHLDVAPGQAAAAYLTEEGLVDELPCGPWQDLAYQERLTKLLTTAEPVLTSMPADPVPWIEEQLGVPVVLTAYGPDRADRRSRVAA
ncbi:adenylosuccinate synthetase [Tenggerimyces flavus]|uniref:Adenylosuccinate synthetase n=1 Tax=Tenggerimyces flavus TaxID=1708749 RepID=A0ABV7Y805_9ACTN|nr:adenylosuccinate synthetase [Tenggerimyces flavus]MBM7788285.1 adenylosuccinate synthase [Tenggerimyces flavus]